MAHSPLIQQQLMLNVAKTFVRTFEHASKAQLVNVASALAAAWNMLGHVAVKDQLRLELR